MPLSSMPNRLRIALALAKVKQVDVRRATDIPGPNLSNLVRGAYGTVTIVTARKLADFFGCQIEDLFPPRDGEAAV